MTDATAILQRKINSALELQSVVRTMKMLAAASIGQFEKSVNALADYNRAVELGLSVCIRNSVQFPVPFEQQRTSERGIVAGIVFGSDQGLVGQFNEVVTDYAIKSLAGLSAKPKVWAVGERVLLGLQDAGIKTMGVFNVPSSVEAIASLVGQIQIETEDCYLPEQFASLYLFYNCRKPACLFEPVCLRLLPLDNEWQKRLVKVTWPTKNLPVVIQNNALTLSALIREYLFVSLFKACAESIASENASRLAAMERADKNIEEMLEKLHNTFHQLRQASIDEELFDVISGCEATNQKK